MKILHFYKNALPESIGGVEQVIDQIARGTGVLGVKNTVLSLGDSPTIDPTVFNNYELIKARRNFELASNSVSWEVVSLFRDLAANADLIHYHFPWPFADFLNLLAPKGKPTLVTYHSDIVRQKLLLQIYKPLKHKFLKSVDHIVATSPNYMRTSSVLRAYQKKLSVIPIGLDCLTYIRPDPKSIDFYKKCFGDKFFLFIGAFRYYKGLNFLVQAARIVSYPIVIAGSGEVESQLRAYISKHQLKNVFLLGQVSEENKCALLEACYGVVFPSDIRAEAFGVYLLEGAMFCKPLISCEIGTGTSFININQETGLVVSPSDPIDLARAMAWLWMNPERAKEMGQKAHTRFKNLFTARKMSQTYFELYQNLINSRKENN